MTFARSSLDRRSPGMNLTVDWNSDADRQILMGYRCICVLDKVRGRAIMGRENDIC